MVTVKIEHLKDINAVRVTSRDPNATSVNRQFVRGIDRLMLVSSHIADEDQRQVGALVALLLRARPGVSVIDIVHTDAGYWFATALEETEGSGLRRYRGEGMSVTEAVICLLAYAQGL
jgi:hypothetical protein